MNPNKTNLALVRGENREAAMPNNDSLADAALSKIDDLRDEAAMLRVQVRSVENQLEEAKDGLKHDHAVRAARTEGRQARIRHRLHGANPHNEHGSARERELFTSWLAGFERANEDEVLLNFLAVGQEMLDNARINDDGSVTVDVHHFHVAVHALERAREFAAF